MDVANQIVTSVETLEALYFLLKSFSAHQGRLAMIRAEHSRLGHADQLKTLEELAAEIEDIRTQAGAFAKDEEYRELLCRSPSADGSGISFQAIY